MSSHASLAFAEPPKRADAPGRRDRRVRLRRRPPRDDAARAARFSFFISARRVAPPFSPGGVSREGTSSSTVVSNAERSNGAFRSRAPKSSATRSPETRAVRSGHRLDHPPAPARPSATCVSGSAARARRVRARQRAAAAFFARRRAVSVSTRVPGSSSEEEGSGFHKRALAAVAAFRRKGSPGNASFPSGSASARSSSAALGLSAAAQPFRGARRPSSRGARRRAARAETPSGTPEPRRARSASAARRGAPRLPVGPPPRPSLFFRVLRPSAKPLFASISSERKRVVRVVLLRGDRGEAVHERRRSCPTETRRAVGKPSAIVVSLVSRERRVATASHTFRPRIGSRSSAFCRRAAASSPLRDGRRRRRTRRPVARTRLFRSRSPTFVGFRGGSLSFAHRPFGRRATSRARPARHGDDVCFFFLFFFFSFFLFFARRASDAASCLHAPALQTPPQLASAREQSGSPP